jgi:hypothetical protein
VISEEVNEEKEKEYDMACISNSLVDILNNLYDKKIFDQIMKDLIAEIIQFIKEKEKNI